MARVAPLLSSSSALFLMLSPIVLTMLIASWPTPAVEARFLQAHDEPQWMQEIHKSPVEDKLPFEVRMRRSPQEPEAAEPEQSKPGFFSRVWTSIKNIASMAFQAVGNFFSGIFGGSSSHGAGNEDTGTPRPHDGDRSSPEPGDSTGDSSKHFDVNPSASSPTRDAIATSPDHDGEVSPTSAESHEKTKEPIDDFAPSSDNGDGSSPGPNYHEKSMTGDGRAPVNDRDGGSTPLPGDGHETTSVPFIEPESEENEIPDN